MQAGQLGLGPLVVGRVRGHRRRRRTHKERHDEAEQDKGQATEHRTAGYQNFSALSCTPLLLSMEKIFQILKAKNFFEKISPSPYFFVDTSPVLLYKRFRSTTRE
jgi:hypothetical protein